MYCPNLIPESGVENRLGSNTPEPYFAPLLANVFACGTKRREKIVKIAEDFLMRENLTNEGVPQFYHKLISLDIVWYLDI